MSRDAGASGRWTNGVPGPEIDDNHWRAAMAGCMIKLSRDLDVTVTAEGVETVEQLRNLQDLGCDCVQGYLLGRPMRGSEVVEFLNGWLGGGKAALLTAA